MDVLLLLTVIHSPMGYCGAKTKLKKKWVKFFWMGEVIFFFFLMHPLPLCHFFREPPPHILSDVLYD